MAPPGSKCLPCGPAAAVASDQQLPPPPVRAGPVRAGSAGDIAIAVPPVDDRNPLPSCCPDISKQTNWSQYFQQRQSSSTQTLNDTYGLQFLPNAAMDAQMMAYAQWAASWRPYGWYPNSILLRGELHELTADAPAFYGQINASTVATYFTHAGYTNVGVHTLRAWWTTPTSGIWNGPPPFDNSFADLPALGSVLAPQYMRHDKIYILKLSLELASKDHPQGTPNDPSWHVLPFDCMQRYVVIAANYQGFRALSGSAAATSSLKSF